MTSEELIKNLRSFLDRQTSGEMERRFLRVAFDLKDAVRDRVQNSGTDRRGQPFAPYVPGYARQRQKAGAQFRKVDYTRSGRLWASITPEIESSNEREIVISIGPRTRENQVKLLGPGTLKPRKDGVQRGLPTLPNDRELSEAFEGMVEEVIDDFENSVR